PRAEALSGRFGACAGSHPSYRCKRPRAHLQGRGISLFGKPRPEGERLVRASRPGAVQDAAPAPAVAGEVAIGEVEAGDRATEAAGAGLDDVEAWLDWYAAHRGVDPVALNP